jgi:hypothetical protein
MEHDSIDRCVKCLGTREKCLDCKWKWKCGKQFKNKNTFKYHLKKQKLQLPKSKTGEKLVSNEYILEHLSQKCCATKCIEHWTINEIKSWLRKISVLSNLEKSNKIVEMLQMMIVDETDCQVSNKINTVSFNLKIMGKTVCPTSFVFLNGVSYKKCAQLVQNFIVEKTNNLKDFLNDELEMTNFPEVSNNLQLESSSSQVTIKSRIISFLQFIYESEIFTEPMVGFPESHKRITFFTR